MCYDVCGSNTYGHRMPSNSCSGFRRRSQTKTHAGRTVIVCSPHTLSDDRRILSKIIIQKSCDDCTIIAGSPYGARAMPLRRLYGLRVYDFKLLTKCGLLKNRRGYGDRRKP